MSVNIDIPSVMGRYSDNKLSFQVPAKTVGEALNEMGKEAPGLKKLLLDNEGNLMPGYEVYVNGENAYPQNLAMPVKNGDKLNIVMLIYGG